MDTFEREAMFYNACAIATQMRYQLMQQSKFKYGTWEEVWHARQGLFPAQNPEKLWAELCKTDIRCIVQDHPDYPPLLKEAHDAPLALYVRGNLSPALSIAIVGTRKASDYGVRQAKRFARTLADNNISIVSGLAFGIDKAAHEGAVENGGHTVGVLAHGLDTVYPASHAGLARTILDAGGALVSEYPCGIPSYPNNFISRNRIISGLSKGILIIEAPAKSGALRTITFAANQSRDVFVLPGQADDPLYLGSHQLIRDGAELVTEPDHIMAAYGVTPKTGIFKKPQEQEHDPSTTAILSALQTTSAPLTIDKIAELTNLNIQIVLAIITIQILRHTIEETPNGIRLLH